MAKVAEGVSSLSELAKFIETFKQGFPNTKSKVSKYFSELEYCFTKGESDEKVRDACNKLYNGFPTDRQRYVENYLKIQVFQDIETARQKLTDETPGKEEELTNMASPSPVTYSLKDFEEEINRIGTNESKKILADLKRYLEIRSVDNVKHLADKLQREIQTKEGAVMSEDAQKIVSRLRATGSESDVTVESKSGTTTMHVYGHKGAESGMPQGGQAVQKGKENMAKTFHGGLPESQRQPVGSQTMNYKAPDPPLQTSMATTLPPTSASSAKQLTADYKESDQVTEVLKLLQGCMSSDSGDVPTVLQMQPIALALITEFKNNRILSLIEQLETSQQDYQRLEKEKKDVEDAYNKSCLDNAAEKSDIEKKFDEHLQQEHQLNVQLQADLKQVQKSKEMVEDKLRKTAKESAELQEQFQQHAEDNARQKQKLSEEVHRLHRDNKELKSRVSELAGAKLMDNNPDIADLSDPNRALKLGEKFSSLYDDDWTDAYQTYTEKFNMKEDEAIYFLLQVLLKTYDFCRKVADEQMDCLCNVFENPCQDIPKILTLKKEKTQITQKQFKDLKDLRKQIGLRKAGSITKQYVSKEYEEVKKGDKKLKSMLDETKSYYEKCVEVCWPMVLHDPPVRMEHPIKSGTKIDGNRFRLYGGNGDVLEYLVWPPLLVEGGGLLAKGVAKPKKTPRTVKKP